MTLKELVAAAQRSLGITDDGDWGPVTDAKAADYDIMSVVITEKKKQPVPTGTSEAPWSDEAHKHAGKTEHDSVFSRFLSGFWKIVGLPGYKTIKGNSFAWCGLFLAAMLNVAGYNHIKNGAGAKNWDKFGQAISWKENGIPRGAFIRINHSGNCSSGSGNHITTSEGDCAPGDLKPGATVRGFGGNQGDKATISSYPVNDICSVRWPDKKQDGSPVPLPAPIKVSNGCAGGKYVPESTR